MLFNVKLNLLPILDESENDELSDEVDGNFEVDDSFELAMGVGEIVNKVRGIVKIFKKSPKLNGILQAHMLTEIQQELQLQLDVKTRWNSMLSMLKTFTRATNAIKKALTDINRLEVWSWEFEHSLKDIYEVLSVTKMTMDQISKDDATLLTAEGAFEFLFDELSRINTPLSLEMLDKVKEEILKRRNKAIVSLLKFLQDPESLNENKYSFFEMPTKKEIIKTASSVWNQYFLDQTKDSLGAALLDEQLLMDDQLSIEDRLGIAVKKRTSKAQPVGNVSSFDSTKLIKLEIDAYASSNVMPRSLDKIRNALLTIKPTSIKNEQNFSMSSNFLSKTRMRMGIKTLNNLCILKSHYIRKEKTEK